MFLMKLIKKQFQFDLHVKFIWRLTCIFYFTDKKFRNDLHQWNPIVHKNRVAEQIFFPLQDENLFSRVQNAAEKAKGFEPKTELERLTEEILGKSKYNITNEDAYCEAEKEVIKAMSLEEVRNKCQELQKMRALMSYRAIKMNRESKIKSKQ